MDDAAGLLASIFSENTSHVLKCTHVISEWYTEMQPQGSIYLDKIGTGNIVTVDIGSPLYDECNVDVKFDLDPKFKDI